MKKKVLGPEVRIENIGLVKQVEDQLTTRGEAVMEVPLDKVREKENVRKEYKGIEELAASIKEKGLLQPVVITPAEDGFYDLIFGHRRYRALVMLHSQEPETYFKIKAIVRERDFFDPDEVKEVQLIENIQREALSPLDLKEALEYLRERGLTQKQIGERLGKSESYIRNLFLSVKTLNDTPELEELMKHHTGVMLPDLMYLRVLPKAALLKVAEEKAKGLIKTRAELEERIAAVRAEAYGDYRQKREEKQKHPSPFIKERKDGSLRFRSFNCHPGKTPVAEVKAIVAALKDALSRLEGVAS